MRAGLRQANMAPPVGEPDGDEGMGGLGGDVMARVELELSCNTHFAYTTKSCKVSSQRVLLNSRFARAPMPPLRLARVM
jgi:hypothetical protein